MYFCRFDNAGILGIKKTIKKLIPIKNVSNSKPEIVLLPAYVSVPTGMIYSFKKLGSNAVI